MLFTNHQMDCIFAYSSLNRVTLDMNFDELILAPGEDDDDDSPVEEMSPIKAKKASKRALKAKKNDTKEKELPKD
ncbi:hypothetical protein Tco_1117900 [Tanacetum coccineum]